jgi:phosphoribosyl 1,2-cyclic phosphodiesterase
MRFITLSSSSAGNGYLLKTSSGEILIIEAGVSLMELKKALDFNLSKIAGCIVSHSHKDHSGYLYDYQKAGINCSMNQQTKESIWGEMPIYNVNVLQTKKVYEIGSFKVQPFDLKHDVQNFGYLINHPESGLFCFITDTHYCPYTFPGMNNILVEANYSDEIIEAKLLRGSGNMFVRNRVIQSHMEIDTTAGFLKANDLKGVNNIVLLHLSEGNSNAHAFKKRIQDVTGKTIYVAEPGLDIEFNKQAF